VWYTWYTYTCKIGLKYPMDRTRIVSCKLMLAFRQSLECLVSPCTVAMHRYCTLRTVGAFSSKMTIVSAFKASLCLHSVKYLSTNVFPGQYSLPTLYSSQMIYPVLKSVPSTPVPSTTWFNRIPLVCIKDYNPGFRTVPNACTLANIQCRHEFCGAQMQCPGARLSL